MPGSRVVLDTNVYVSALWNPTGLPARVARELLDAGRVLTSDPLLAELRDVLGRPSLRARLGRERPVKLLASLVSESIHVNSAIEVADIPDPKDEMLFALALAGEADYLITGDKALWGLDPYGTRPIRVLDLAQFRRLDGSAG